MGDELFWGKVHYSKKHLLTFVFESETVYQVIDNGNTEMFAI